MYKNEVHFMYSILSYNGFAKLKSKMSNYYKIIQDQNKLADSLIQLIRAEYSIKESNE